MAFGSKPLRAVGGEERWDGIAFLDAQARVQLRHHLARLSRSALIALIVEQEDAIGDVYEALIEAEQTTGALKEQNIRAGRLDTKILDGRLMTIRTAMERCKRAFAATAGDDVSKPTNDTPVRDDEKETAI